MKVKTPKRLVWKRSLAGLGAIASVTIASMTVGPGALSPAAQAQSEGPNAARDPQQVPTARYGRGEAVDLSFIIDEWRDRYPELPIFVCSCNADTCGDTERWPFREYTRYQPSVALGDFNAAYNETNSFNCFNMETGARPNPQSTSPVR
ncbi:MAG: hypothetical protein WBD47_03780 [Phormidesmis sp.]